MSQASLHLLFATPLWLAPWAQAEVHNPVLLATVRALQQQQAGAVVSNVGGWHSTGNLFTLDIPAVRELHGYILAQLGHLLGELEPGSKGSQQQATLTGWANVLPPGGYHKLHHHPGQHWSGCYYLTVPPAEPDSQAGRLELLDPRSGADQLPQPGQFFSPSATVTAQAGLLVLFPAWLNHMVHPHNGPGERIAIAFNIHLEEAVGAGKA